MLLIYFNSSLKKHLTLILVSLFGICFELGAVGLNLPPPLILLNSAFLFFFFYKKLAFFGQNSTFPQTNSVIAVREIVRDFLVLFSVSVRCFFSLVKFSYWSMFHVNIIAGSGVMTISFNKGLPGNPKIGHIAVSVSPNI